MAKSTRVIRVGVAGLGRSGWDIHVDWLRQVPKQYRIVAVADQIDERRVQAATELGVTPYPDYGDLLRAGGIDLFVNALPTPLHVCATIEALRAGIDVLCEKPAAPTVKELDRMIATAKKRGRVLAFFQNNRAQPFFTKMREVIDSGVLGRIVHIRSSWGGFARRWDWQTFQCNHGGSLYNTGPHAVDHAVVLFGDREEPKVSCVMASHNALGGDAEDFCALTIHGERSPTIEIMISAYEAYPPPELYTVSGTLGGLTGSATSLRWRYYEPAKAPKQKVWRRWSEGRRYPEEELRWVEKSWKVPKAATAGKASGYTLRSFEVGRAALYDNLHDVLCGHGKLFVTHAQVRRQIGIIEEAHRQNPLPRRFDAWVPGKGPVRKSRKRPRP